MHNYSRHEFGGGLYSNTLILAKERSSQFCDSGRCIYKFCKVPANLKNVVEASVRNDITFLDTKKNILKKRKKKSVTNMGYTGTKEKKKRNTTGDI